MPPEQRMTKVLRLMADYRAFPIWNSGGEAGNVDPAGLPITEQLKADLNSWAAAYDATLNLEYPPDSQFSDADAERAFETEGRRLWSELRAQLGPEYEISYYSEYDE